MFNDPRLSGDAWFVLNMDSLPPRPYSKVWTGTLRIENPDGTWSGTLRGYTDPATKLDSYVFELTGIDGYEGYLALLLSIDEYEFASIQGFVFPGSMPEYPDPIETAPFE